MSSAPFLLLRIPSLKLRVRGRKEAFEANLKTETELWNLMVKEMWAGRNMADQHKVKPQLDGGKIHHSVRYHLPLLLTRLLYEVSTTVCLCLHGSH